MYVSARACTSLKRLSGVGLSHPLSHLLAECNEPPQCTMYCRYFGYLVVGMDGFRSLHPHSEKIVLGSSGGGRGQMEERRAGNLLPFSGADQAFVL